MRRLRSSSSRTCRRACASAVAEGRKEFLSQFPRLADPDVVAALRRRAMNPRSPSPALIWTNGRVTPSAYALHRDLLRLRRDRPVIAAESTRIDGACHRVARVRAPASSVQTRTGCC